MYLFTPVLHPHGHWQLQELLGNNIIGNVRDSSDVRAQDMPMMMMYLFTTVPHPHGHWQLQELLGNQCYHYHYLRLAYLEQPDLL